MTTSRRGFLRLAAGTAVLPAWPRAADAQAYPARPVRVLVAVSPGGTTDLAARLMAQWLAKRLGQPFVIENRPGGATNIATDLMTGVKFQHIPYRGEAPAMTDLIGGQVQLVFATTGSSLQYVKSGKLRALAVTSNTRAKDLPDVPPLADVLPGYEASSWSGFVVPKNTPADIIDKLNRELNVAAADAAIQARFADLGGPPVMGSPADFGRIISNDVAKWAKVIKAAGLTGD